MVNHGNEGLLKILWDTMSEQGGEKSSLVPSPWDLRLFSIAAEPRLSCVLQIFTYLSRCLNF